MKVTSNAFVRRVRKVERDENGNIVRADGIPNLRVVDEHSGMPYGGPRTLGQLAVGFLKELKQRARLGYSSVPTGLSTLDGFLDDGIP
jgi:hypothetical protein